MGLAVLPCGHYSTGVSPSAPRLTASDGCQLKTWGSVMSTTAWPDAPRPVEADALLPERALDGDASACDALADGQVHGGVAQGVAQALLEEFSYDADGNPLTNYTGPGFDQSLYLLTWVVIDDTALMGVQLVGDGGRGGTTFRSGHDRSHRHLPTRWR